jgi:hypothetical protein
LVGVYSIESILPIIPIYAIKGISKSPITEPIMTPITFLAFLSLANADLNIFDKSL